MKDGERQIPYYVFVRLLHKGTKIVWKANIQIWLYVCPLDRDSIVPKQNIFTFYTGST